MGPFYCFLKNSDTLLIPLSFFPFPLVSYIFYLARQRLRLEPTRIASSASTVHIDLTPVSRILLLRSRGLYDPTSIEVKQRSLAGYACGAVSWACVSIGRASLVIALAMLIENAP